MKIKTYFVQKIKLHEHIAILLIFMLIGTLGISLSHHLAPARESLLIALYAFIVFFIYYLVMLYRGIRYDNGYVQWKWNGLSINDMVSGIKEHGFDIGLPDFSIIDFGDNLLGAVFAFVSSVILAIFIGIFAAVLIWAGVNAVGYLLLLSWIPLYALARFGIRIALANVRKTKGSMVASLPYALINSIFASLTVFSSMYIIEKTIYLFHGIV